MAGFTFTEQFDAPLSTVFEEFSRVDQAAGKIPGILRIAMLTPLPIDVGTKFQETRMMFKREHTETFEFTQFVPNEHYELTVNSCGARHQTSFRFAPEGNGTRVVVDFHVEAISFFAKLMKPFAGLMMGTIQKCVQDDVAAIRKAIEQPQQAAS